MKQFLNAISSVKKFAEKDLPCAWAQDTRQRHCLPCALDLGTRQTLPLPCALDGGALQTGGTHT